MHFDKSYNIFCMQQPGDIIFTPLVTRREKGIVFIS